MRIILVRHAESTANALNVNGGPEVELSEKGLEQAARLAKRLSGEKVDLIMCSRLRRAMQTAEIVNALLCKRIDYNDVLNEWRWPADQKIRDLIYANAHDPNWHYENRETPHEITARAKKALAHIRAAEGDSVLVVTHGAFLCALLGLVIFGEGMTPSELRRVSDVIEVVNTGITQLEADKDGRLKLISFNEHTHLGL